jgi:GTP cyclohydrolase I
LYVVKTGRSTWQDGKTFWAGREGLIDTPRRVARAYGELFSGYGADPVVTLAAPCEEGGDYGDRVLAAGVRGSR